MTEGINMETIQVNIFQAKTELSKLISMLERKEQEQIIIARNGKPIATISLYTPIKKKRKLGKFNGKFELPDDINDGDEEVRELLES